MGGGTSKANHGQVTYRGPGNTADECSDTRAGRDGSWLPRVGMDIRLRVLDAPGSRARRCGGAGGRAASPHQSERTEHVIPASRTGAASFCVLAAGIGPLGDFSRYRIGGPSSGSYLPTLGLPQEKYGVESQSAACIMTGPAESTTPRPSLMRKPIKRSRQG